MTCSKNRSPEKTGNDSRKLQAQELWKQLVNIPVNENDEIDEDFLHFPEGTNKLDVWHWFEETFELSVAEDLLYTNSTFLHAPPRTFLSPNLTLNLAGQKA